MYPTDRVGWASCGDQAVAGRRPHRTVMCPGPTDFIQRFSVGPPDCRVVRQRALGRWEPRHTSLAVDRKLAMEGHQLPRMEAATSIDEELRALNFG